MLPDTEHLSGVAVCEVEFECPVSGAERWTGGSKSSSSTFHLFVQNKNTLCEAEGLWDLVHLFLSRAVTKMKDGESLCHSVTGSAPELRCVRPAGAQVWTE